MPLPLASSGSLYGSCSWPRNSVGVNRSDFDQQSALQRCATCGRRGPAGTEGPRTDVAAQPDCGRSVPLARVVPGSAVLGSVIINDAPGHRGHCRRALFSVPGCLKHPCCEPCGSCGRVRVQESSSHDTSVQPLPGVKTDAVSPSP